MDVDEQVLDATAVLADHEAQNEEMPLEKAFIDVGNLAIFSYELPDGESYRETATRLGQELINKIFHLPVEKSKAGPLAKLPKPLSPLPREKSLPVPKPETKWEKFAREKGIGQKKKESKVWDTDTDQWRHRWGRDSKANNQDDWAVEHKEGKLGEFEDPFIQAKSMKKQRIEENEKKRMANKRRQTVEQNAQLMGSKNSASLVIGSLAPTASSVSKERLERAIQVAQRATRSLGVFDEKRTDAPRDKLLKKKLPTAGEADHASQSKVLKKVMRTAERSEAEYDSQKMANQQIQEHKVKAKRDKVAKEEAVEDAKRKRKLR